MRKSDVSERRMRTPRCKKCQRDSGATKRPPTHHTTHREVRERSAALDDQQRDSDNRSGESPTIASRGASDGIRLQKIVRPRSTSSIVNVASPSGTQMTPNVRASPSKPRILRSIDQALNCFR